MLLRIFLMMVAALLVMVMPGSAAEKAGTPVANLAKDIEDKIVLKDRARVKVQTEGCRISISFVNQSVTFHLPLAGTTVSAEDDTLFVVNSGMTRKVSDRQHEPFSRLMLRFGSNTIDQVRSSFVQAIQACGS